MFIFLALRCRRDFAYAIELMFCYFHCRRAAICLLRAAALSLRAGVYARYIMRDAHLLPRAYAAQRAAMAPRTRCL